MKKEEVLASLKKFLMLVLIARRVSHELWHHVKNSEFLWERVIAWAKIACRWSATDTKAVDEIATQIKTELQDEPIEKKRKRFEEIVEKNLSTVAETAKLHNQIDRVLKKTGNP